MRAIASSCMFFLSQVQIDSGGPVQENRPRRSYPRTVNIHTDGDRAWSLALYIESLFTLVSMLLKTDALQAFENGNSRKTDLCRLLRAA